MSKKPSFDQQGSDLRPVYYHNYFGMVDGMEYPPKDPRYYGDNNIIRTRLDSMKNLNSILNYEQYYPLSDSNMRNSCLQNDVIWVDKLKTGVPDFYHKEYIYWDENKRAGIVTPSSTFINEGTYKGKPSYIKTIMAVDRESIKDIQFNIEAYNVMPAHIAEIIYINKCDVSNKTDKNLFDFQTNENIERLEKINKLHVYGLIVVAIEKISSFEKEITILYEKYKNDKDMTNLKEIIEKLTETCDLFNSYGFFHTNLKYQNIGIRPANFKLKTPYRVVLTDFAEATHTTNKVTPLNSLFMCLKLYIKYKQQKSTPEWVMYLLSKTCFYFKVVMDNTDMTADVLAKTLVDDYIIMDLDSKKKITKIPVEVIEGIIELENKVTVPIDLSQSFDRCDFKDLNFKNIITDNGRVTERFPGWGYVVGRLKNCINDRSYDNDNVSYPKKMEQYSYEDIENLERVCDPKKRAEDDPYIYENIEAECEDIRADIYAKNERVPIYNHIEGIEEKEFQSKCDNVRWEKSKDPNLCENYRNAKLTHEYNIKNFSPSQRAEKFEETKKTREPRIKLEKEAYANMMEKRCDFEIRAKDKLNQSKKAKIYCTELTERSPTSGYLIKRDEETCHKYSHALDRYVKYNEDSCDNYRKAKLKHELKNFSPSVRAEKLKKANEDTKKAKEEARKRVYIERAEKAKKRAEESKKHAEDLARILKYDDKRAAKIEAAKIQAKKDEKKARFLAKQVEDLEVTIYV
jgi:hypothetical protein